MKPDVAGSGSASERARQARVIAQLETERVVLGQFPLAPDTAPEIIVPLLGDGDAFVGPGHRAIYLAARKLGAACDLQGLHRELGGTVDAAYLSQLTDDGMARNREAIEYHCRAMLTEARRRGYRDALRGLNQRLEQGDDPDEAAASFDEARGKLPSAGSASGLVVVTSEGLDAMDRPAREYVFDPWLRAKDLAEIYSPRGLGKTWFALGVASAIASAGEFLGWRAPKARNVLYIDGEMAAEDLKERARIIGEGCRHDRNGHLRFLAADLQERGLPNLADPAGQRAIESHFDGIEVLFLDNLSCLCRGYKENDAESWEPIQEWLLSLRRRGLTVPFLHHAGKSGLQRGTSKHEDVLDVVLALKRPADYNPMEGARFEIHFEKARNLRGDGVTPIEAKLTSLPLSGKHVWTIRRLEQVTADRVYALADGGFTQSEIAKEVGRNKSTVSRILKGRPAAKEEGF